MGHTGFALSLGWVHHWGMRPGPLPARFISTWSRGVYSTSYSACTKRCIASPSLRCTPWQKRSEACCLRPGVSGTPEKHGTSLLVAVTVPRGGGRANRFVKSRPSSERGPERGCRIYSDKGWLGPELLARAGCWDVMPNLGANW